MPTWRDHRLCGSIQANAAFILWLTLCTSVILWRLEEEKKRERKIREKREEIKEEKKRK